MEELKETKKNTERMAKCPSFINCSATKCPLDELYDIRVKIPSDPKCKATKRSRLLIGTEMKYKGLTGQEYNGIMRSYGSIEAYQKHISSDIPLSKKDKTS